MRVSLKSDPQAHIPWHGLSIFCKRIHDWPKWKIKLGTASFMEHFIPSQWVKHKLVYIWIKVKHGKQAKKIKKQYHMSVISIFLPHCRRDYSTYHIKVSDAFVLSYQDFRCIYIVNVNLCHMITIHQLYIHFSIWQSIKIKSMNICNNSLEYPLMGIYWSSKPTAWSWH